MEAVPSPRPDADALFPVARKRGRRLLRRRTHCCLEANRSLFNRDRRAPDLPCPPACESVGSSKMDSIPAAARNFRHVKRRASSVREAAARSLALAPRAANQRNSCPCRLALRPGGVADCTAVANSLCRHHPRAGCLQHLLPRRCAGGVETPRLHCGVSKCGQGRLRQPQGAANSSERYARSAFRAPLSITERTSNYFRRNRLLSQPIRMGRRAFRSRRSLSSAISYRAKGRNSSSEPFIVSPTLFQSCNAGSSEKGPDRQRLEALANDLGIRPRIHFMGRQSRAAVADAMRRCSMFVLPSRNEGLGCVYLEAMACARPVIACHGQGIEEIVEHQKNGWLISPDNLDELEQAISTFLRSPELSLQIGQSARQTVLKGLTLSHQAQQLAAIYRGITGTRQAA